MAKLTEKQKRFVQEYLVDLNATAAAKRAGYSAKTADRIGPELLGKTCVSEAVKAAIEKRSARTGITQDRVLEELAAIAFARGTDYAGIISGVALYHDTDKLTDSQKAAIVSIKSTKDGVEIKLANKLKALELLGRHLGIFSASQARGGLEDEPAIDDLEQTDN